ncbi:MAG: HEAT repeat domain-containing protein [Gemmatimonadetes bacterium]|nr:HEAT repeat domain-containing protein [Gemmatimonadota bacterium]
MDQASRPPTKHLEAIEHLMRALVKAYRAAQLYRANNLMYRETLEALRAAFPPVWELLEELTLEVSEDAFLWEDTPVLSERNRGESVVWTLFKDGIRSLTLSPGVEDREIVGLIRAMLRARELGTDAPDDLLTLLWQGDFQHIRYAFVELGQDEAPQIQPSGASPEPGSEDTIQQRVAEEVTDMLIGGGLSSAGIPQPLEAFRLDDADIAYLRGEIDREYQRDLGANVMTILFEILELQTNTAVRTEVIFILEEFFTHLLGTGDLRGVALLLRKTETLLGRAPKLIPDHLKALRAIPRRINEPGALDPVLQTLDSATDLVDEEDVAELFKELDHEMLVTMLSSLSQMTTRRARFLARQAIQHVAQEHPDRLARALEVDDEAVLLDALHMAAESQATPLVPQLGALLVHTNDEIRRATVDALGAAESPEALDQLDRAVDDQDHDVRVAAMQQLVDRRHRPVLPKIEAVVIHRGMRGADLREKMPFFEAYGLLAGDKGVEPLFAILQGTGLFRRKDDAETRACAALALGKIGTSAARTALHSVHQSKEPLVRNAISRALKEIG